jgi:hypothetical protein
LHRTAQLAPATGGPNYSSACSKSTRSSARRGATLRVNAAIEDPDIARKILEWLKLPARSPPLEPAAASGVPPESDAPDPEAE